jgi:hypothetical protein
VVKSPSCTSAARWQLGAHPLQSARTPPSCMMERNACHVFLSSSALIGHHRWGDVARTSW